MFVLSLVTIVGGQTNSNFIKSMVSVLFGFNYITSYYEILYYFHVTLLAFFYYYIFFVVFSMQHTHNIYINGIMWNNEENHHTWLSWWQKKQQKNEWTGMKRKNVVLILWQNFYVSPIINLSTFSRNLQMFVHARMECMFVQLFSYILWLNV